jgi:hypothetical protein
MFLRLWPTFSQIAAGGKISRFQVFSSFAVQDYEKAVNKTSSPAGSNVLLAAAILFFGWSVLSLNAIMLKITVKGYVANGIIFKSYNL